MDEKETQSLGMCNRLFNFITKRLALQSLKKTTLGCLTNRGAATAPPSDAIHGKGGTESNQVVDPMAQGTSGKPAVSGAKLGLKTDNSKESNSSSPPPPPDSSLQNDEVKDDKELPSTQGVGDAENAEKEEASAQQKAPKKMVSINDRTEDIHKIMKKRKKNKSFDRSNSLENGEDEIKPLKSILKVGSNLDESTVTEAHVNQNGS